MGIEYIARAQRIISNHRVTSMHKRCVRLLCENRCHTSQRQPMRPAFKASTVRPEQGKSTFSVAEEMV